MSFHQPSTDHVAALLEAQAALTALLELQALPAERLAKMGLSDADCAALEAIARYNLMCCHEAGGAHKTALEHAKGARQALGAAPQLAAQASSVALKLGGAVET